MSEFLLSPEAEAELDDIWIHMARESGSIDIATRVVESITERFWLLARYPYMGRRRDDLRPGLRSFTAGDYIIIHRVVEDDVVLICTSCTAAATSPRSSASDRVTDFINALATEGLNGQVP